MDVKQMKRAAAERALEYVDDGMILGLGTGSTAAEFVDLLGGKVADGLKVTAVATSEATLSQALSLGIAMGTLDDHPFIDLTVDGADEFDDQLRLIKGGGGALLREKIVASASEQVVIIADKSKRVTRLGAFALPVEVVPFGLTVTQNMIRELSDEVGLTGEIAVRQRKDGAPFQTDGGNLIIDCAFGEIPDPEELADLLPFIPGVVDHGLFIGLADVAVVGGEDGVTVLEGPTLAV